MYQVCLSSGCTATTLMRPDMIAGPTARRRKLLKFAGAQGSWFWPPWPWPCASKPNVADVIRTIARISFVMRVEIILEPMGMSVSRRGFVGTLGATVGAGCLPYVPVFANSSIEPDKVVHTSGDGIAITPREYAALLNRLCQGRDVADDNYLLGGEVEAFERHWAALLGKETAVFMPSGTLANQLALRVLAGTKRRVIVPEVSHIYNDTGDACQTLSNLTLMPLAPGRATFTKGDVEAVLTRTAGGRVATDVGAIVIESPIRRLAGQMFDWDEAKRISAFAREKGIGMHLDGARLFIASAYTGISPAEYSAHFDTVYVSLWKYFNCGDRKSVV